jgi:hypothetical protein
LQTTATATAIVQEIDLEKAVIATRSGHLDFQRQRYRDIPSRLIPQLLYHRAIRTYVHTYIPTYTGLRASPRIAAEH